MIIIGLGSNLGRPLSNLREAVRRLHLLTEIQVTAISSVYRSEAELPSGAPEAWRIPYLNMAVQCRTKLAPPALLALLQQLEINMGRPITKEKWAPRIIDLDILIWDDVVYADNALTIPHPQLWHRPFALLPLLELLPNWRHPELSQLNWLESQPVPFNTHKIKHLATESALVGIINVTPDSFSDGGKYPDVTSVLDEITRMTQAGAEVIDIGAESTRPGATPISADEEWQRLGPVLEALTDLKIDQALKPQISIDTRQAKTVIKALQYPIDWINDVSGTECQAIARALSGSHIRYVSMHNLGVPPKRLLPDNCDPVAVIYTWAEQQITCLQSFGLQHTQIIIDIGVGFGLSPMQTWQVLARAKQFKSLGVPILIGHSRKSFMKAIAPDMAERDAITAIISHYLAQQDIDYLRVHNVALVNQALAVQRLLHEEKYRGIIKPKT